MKIQEVENLLQITRANIRFYEKEGFINPTRNENKYREYSEEDIEILKKVIILRKLGFSIESIKKILNDSIDLHDAIEENLIQLKEQIKSLEGSIEVCEQLKKEEYTNNAFNTDTYWTLIQNKEENGSTFMDIVKDYIEFEKQGLVSIWQNVFFYDLENTVSTHGWKIGFSIVIILCILRGLAVQFLWKSGSFLSGFLYPFALFLLVSIVTFPLFILNKKYNNEQVEVTIFDKIPFIIKVFAGILYLCLLLVGFPILMENIYTSIIMHNEIYILSSPMFILYFIMGIYILFLFVWLYSKYGLFGNSYTNFIGLKAHLPKKIKQKVLIISILLFLLSMFSYIPYNEVFTTKGITVNHITSKEYTWDDVHSYDLKASMDGYLTFEIKMKDNTTYSPLGGGIMFSNLAEEIYPNAEEDYIKELIQIFKEKEIPCTVKDWNQLYEDLGYEYWSTFAKELHNLITK